jgi:hypothetical protein
LHTAKHTDLVCQEAMGGNNALTPVHFVTTCHERFIVIKRSNIPFVHVATNFRQSDGCFRSQCTKRMSKMSK